MNKKIILGVLSATIIGFGINSFANSKNVISPVNSVGTNPQASDVQVLDTNNSKAGNIGLTQASLNFNSLSTYNASGSFKATVENGTQTITTELEPYGYPNLIIQKGVPFKWVINASEANLNSCNNEILISSLGLSKPLQVGENIIEFTLTESGITPYSCWMGMQTGTIAVVDDLNSVNENEIQTQIQALPPTAGCCG